MTQPYLFINYRRDDTWAFAVHLHDRLKREFGESQLFFDLHGIESGAKWPDTIDQALKRTTCMLVLIGSRWLQVEKERSERRLDIPDDWVRREIKSALENRVTVIPTLVSGPSETKLPECEGLPEEICGLVDWQAHPVRMDSLDQNVEELVNLLETRYEFRRISQTSLPDKLVTRRRDTYTQQSLPENYVVRKDLLDHLKRWLLESGRDLSPTPSSKLFALHGMGGTGKSVVARALCDDKAVHAAFPDGILWASIGQTPDLVTQLVQWISHLGGNIAETVPTVDSLKVQLSELIKQGEYLLVLDDVWEKSHVRAFQVDATGCRILMTTRDRKIADELLANVESVPVLLEHEAIAALERSAKGKIDNAPRAIKLRVVKTVGCLALAVRLAGAQLQQIDPARWLAGFDPKRLASDRPEDIHDSLYATISLSFKAVGKRKRRLYLALGVFKEDDNIPVHVVERLWNQLDDVDAAQLLDDLSARALLEVVRRDGGPSVQLHDMLRAFARHKLGERSKKVHAALLSSYRDAQGTDQWHSIEDDGYLYHHLVYHLQAIEDDARIQSLFVDDNWLHARVTKAESQFEGYLSDLLTAWRIAHNLVSEDEAEFVNCVRYSLIYTSLNSLAANHSPALAARALQIGVWSSGQARSAAARIPVARRRAEMCGALLQTHRLKRQDEDGDEDIVRRLGLRSLIEDPHSDGLKALAPCLPEDGLERMLELVPEKFGDDGFVALAPALNGDLATRALHLALSPNYKGRLSSVLQTLIPKLPPDQLPLALEATLQIDTEYEQTEALVALALRIVSEPTQASDEIVARCFEAALELRDSTDVVIALIPTLTEHQSARALKESDRHQLLERSSFLASFISSVNEPLLSRGFNALLDVGRNAAAELRRPITLNPPHMIADRRQKTLHRFFSAVKTVASGLTHAQREQLLGMVMDFDDTENRAQFLIALSSALDGPLIRQAADLTDQFRDDSACDASHCGWALAAIASRATGDEKTKLLTRAWDCVRKSRHHATNVRALVELSRQLPDAERHQAMREALDAVREESEFGRRDALKYVAPHLPEQLVPDGLEIALTLSNFGRPYWALATAATKLSGESWRRALDAALAPAGTVNALTAIAAELPDELWPRLLDRLPAEGDRGRRAILTSVAPRLDHEVVQALLNDDVRIADEAARIGALTRFARHVSPELSNALIQQAVDWSLSLTDDWKRMEALAMCADATGKDLDRVFAGMLALPERVGLVDYGLRSRGLAALGGQLSEAQVQIALDASDNLAEPQDRIEVWASLLPVLTGAVKSQLIQRAVDLAISIDGLWNQVYSLKRLATCLTGEALNRSLAAALALDDHAARTYLLVKLLPQLSDGEQYRAQAAALESALKLRDSSWLRFLAPDLKGHPDLVRNAVNAALTFEAESNRVGPIIDLATQMDRAMALRVLGELEPFHDDKYQVDVLIAIAPGLSDDERGRMLQRAFELTQSLPAGIDRAWRFAELVPQLSSEKQQLALHHGIESAMEVELENRPRALRRFLPMVSEKAALLERLRQAEADVLFDNRHNNRECILAMLGDHEHLSSQHVKDAVGKNVLHICRDWNWL